MSDISRRDFLAGVSGAAAAALLDGPAVFGQERPERPPNIVLIMADDLGAHELGCYGNTEHSTPNLDWLAAEGTRFRTCWATPICSPSRVQLLTGRYGFRTGWMNLKGLRGAPKKKSDQFDVGSAQITFAEMLKDGGYATALAGKWQLSGRLPDLIHECGFNDYQIFAYKGNLPEGVKHQGRWEIKAVLPARFWHPSIVRNGEYVPTAPHDYGPDMHASFLLDFIRRNRERPFLAYYPMCLTHKPWEPTPVPGEPGKRTSNGLKPNVEYMDYVVGRILRSLDQWGLRENTIVIFTGDNGTKGDGKGESTELGVHVPLIVNCPGTVPAGVVQDELADFSDFLPTLADLARLPVPAERQIDGHSFAHLLRGEGGRGRDWIFSFRRNKRLLRDKRWLLEGDGRFYDCGDRRDGQDYADVTDSNAPEVRQAKARFEHILAGLPTLKEVKAMKEEDPAALARLQD